MHATRILHQPRVHISLVIAAVSALATIVILAPSGSAAAGDADGDGLDDTLEDTLASRYEPQVWFDSGEDCTGPATADNPGTALARVRPHPADSSKIAIQYVVLYARDCGDIGGISSHNGDVEPVALTLAPNSACEGGYGVYSVKTVAHEGTETEHVDQAAAGNSCTPATIYSAENKHANYLSLSSCDDGGFWGSDHCEESFSLDFNVANVGEDGARRIDELSGHQFPGEYAWSAVPFRGSRGDGGGDAGQVRDKFTNDALLAPA